MALEPRKPDTLASRTTIRRMIGTERITKQGVQHLTAQPAFPRPLDVLDGGRLPIWRVSDVKAYMDKREWDGDPIGTGAPPIDEATVERAREMASGLPPGK